MFSTIRPVLFLVYGPESRRVAMTYIKRSSRLTPELMGMSCYVLLSDQSGEGEIEPVTGVDNAQPAFEDFVEIGGEGLFVEEVSISDVTEMQSAFSRAQSRLATADFRRPAIENGWNVKPGVEPIIVTLVDPSEGKLPDWIQLFTVLRRPFRNNELCLIDSFNVLLGPSFSESSRGVHPDHEVFYYFSRTFITLQSGNYHPDSDVAWIPQTLVLDGRLDNGVTLIPGEDLRENVADVINSMVGLTLTDNSTFSEKDSVRTAGAIRIGVPQKELIREHRENWLHRYFNQNSNVSGQDEVRGHFCRQAALEYIQNSKVESVNDILAENLLGQLNHNASYSGRDYLAKYEQLNSDFENYWTDRIQQIPDKVGSERLDFNLSQREELRESIGSWLKTLTIEESSRVLEIVRGLDNAGLVTHEKTVNDLRSLKVKQIDLLGKFCHLVEPTRLLKYQRLKEWVVSGNDREKDLADIKEELLRVESDLSKIELEASSESTTEDANTSNKNEIELRQRKVTLESQLPGGGSFGSEFSNVLGDFPADEVSRIIDELNPPVKLSDSSDESVSLEGWPYAVQKRVLSTGTQFVIPMQDEEKRIRDTYYQELRKLADLKSDLQGEPDFAVSDAEIIRRKSLLDGIVERDKKVSVLLSECNIAREAVEKYQIGVNSHTEQTSRMLMIKKTTLAELKLAPVFHRLLKQEEKALAEKLKKVEAENSNRKSGRKSTLYKKIVGVLFAMALLVMLVPTQKATLVVPVSSATIAPGKQELSILVGQRSVRLIFPNGLWTSEQLSKLLSGDEIKGERMNPASVRSFNSILQSKVNNGFLEISGNSSITRFETLEIMSGSTGATDLGLEIGDRFKGNYNWLYRGLIVLVCLLQAVWLYRRFHNKSVGSGRVIKSLKTKLKQKELEIEDWFAETELLFSSAGETRLLLSAREEGIKAIDDQAKIVEHLQTQFSEFKNLIEKELEIAGDSSTEEKELPSTRRFYSIFTREELNNIILNDRVREADERKFLDFKEQWSYSRIWSLYSEHGSIDSWSEELNKSADASYGVLLDTTLEKLLTANPEILSESHALVHTLRENLRPLGELCGAEQLGENVRSFLCTKNDDGNSVTIRKKMEAIWTEGQTSFIPEGSLSEMLLVVLRPNLNGRRILAVQNGMPRLLEVPYKETNELFSAIGKRMDYFCSIHQMEKLSQAGGYGGLSAPWENTIVSLGDNLLWSNKFEIRGSAQRPSFFFGEIRLGCSVVELLFRLNGSGLSEQEFIDLSAAMKEKPATSEMVDSDDYAERLSNGLSNLFFGHLELIDSEVFRFYKGKEKEWLEEL